MCFIEYLGYTCGHTGDSVLRPCPLTTCAHVNPVCPVPAVRPQLSRDHCPACRRVMHNRWVDIMEEEHRWMHERGACGCPVEFPALMQPRMIGRDGPDYGGGAGGAVSARPNAQGHGQGYGYGYGGGQSTGSSGSGSGGYYKPGDSKNKNKNKNANNKPGRGRRGGGGGNAKHQHRQEQQQQPQPQPQDHQTKAQTQQQRRQQQRERYPAFEEVRDGENDGDVRYVIRQPSMYGVEWTWDHAKLHEDGRCGCAVRFDKYDPSPSKGPRDVKHPGASAGGDDDHDAGKHVASYTYSGNTNNQLLVRTGGGDPTTVPTSRLGPQVSGGQPARWSYDIPAQIHSLQEICALPARGADDPPRQLDMQTAWFGHQRQQQQQQQAPMAGLPLGLGPECRDPSGHLQAEGQIVLYDVSQQVPLLGLPIGAGPEGLSHAGDFEDCELYRLGHEAQGLRRCSSTAF
ncbi:hypothetical protein DL768_006845 [Monosporascus sp. mg162]|nr:hypothetical protein DL768_006845 [Monosporascus sp. mg162]